MLSSRLRMTGWPAVLLGLVLGVLGVLPGAAPALAADVFVQLNPDTVQAGNLVGIRASCQDNTQPATVESGAFGTLTVQPQQNVLTAAALVPANTRAGTYRVKLNCPGGPDATASLMVLTGGQPSRGPATGFGGTAGERPGGGLLLVGLTALVLGAVFGVLALRRRPAVVGLRLDGGRGRLADRGPDRRPEGGPDGRADRGLDGRADRGPDGRADRGPDGRADRGLDGRADRGPDRRPVRH
ncbi:hypothetical protein ACFFWC_15030 [Plantactinospora siamensis]|uniref:Uncharacterized protein n=1 Tax=Plantactinospora siamensis TaxID=555372 RepID=A0ABV6P0S8_9ACTN